MSVVVVPVSVERSHDCPFEEAVDNKASISVSVIKLSNVTTHGSRERTVTLYIVEYFSIIFSNIVVKPPVGFAGIEVMLR